ncbi:MAG: hypothetical protein RQ758_05365 [Methanomicrobiaceae archaeon]|nr:hypothetical protein [Methanomicrobiaceae archaeon]
MSGPENTTEEPVQSVIEELNQIRDPQFHDALMAKLDRLSLHRKSFTHEDLDQLFRLAFSYANSSLKKEQGEE